MKKNKALALKWIEAFNTRNLEDLLRLYAQDAQHFSPKLKIHRPETKGLIVGKDALRAWWEDAFQRLPKLHYKLMRLTADEEQVFMEYVRQVPSESDINVGEVLEIKAGVIIASRVYHG